MVAIFSPYKKIPALTAQRLQRWAITLRAYRYVIRYRPSDQHAKADGLSLSPIGPDAELDKMKSRENTKISHFVENVIDGLPITPGTIRKHAAQDSQMRKLKSCLISGNWPAKAEADFAAFLPHRHSLWLQDDLIMLQREAHACAVIPKSLQGQMLELLHKSHWGITRMKQMARRYVWWPGIEREIEQCVKSCQPCRQAAKSPDREYCPWPKTSRPWQRVHVDYAGPFRGKMWLVCIDAHSKFPFVAMQEIGRTTTPLWIHCSRFSLWKVHPKL